MLGQNKGKLLRLSHAPYGVPVVLVVVVLRVHIRRIEVQVVAVVGIVDRGGPVVPVRTKIAGARIRTIPVARVREAGVVRARLVRLTWTFHRGPTATTNKSVCLEIT